MTKMLEAMKGVITNVLELEAAESFDAMWSYYRGQAIGVLKASKEVLNIEENEQLWAHYRSEKERFD